MTEALNFADVKNCVFSERTEAIFKAMLTPVAKSRRWTTAPKIRLGAISIPTKRMVFDRKDVEPGGKFYEVKAPMPPGVRWHGLSLISIERQQSDYIGVDNFGQRTFIFSEPPAKVQAVMKSIGVQVPLAPKYQEFDDGGCGGAMSVAAVKQGTAFACNWGC